MLKAARKNGENERISFCFPVNERFHPPFEIRLFPPFLARAGYAASGGGVCPEPAFGNRLRALGAVAEFAIFDALERGLKGADALLAPGFGCV